MSSMFKKKTGPSIKPKFVPRGRPAQPPSTTPVPPAALSAATASTPQPKNHDATPTQRVPSPRAERRTPASQPQRPPAVPGITSGRTEASVDPSNANDQALSSTAPRRSSGVNQATKRSTGSTNLQRKDSIHTASVPALAASSNESPQAVPDVAESGSLSASSARTQQPATPAKLSQQPTSGIPSEGGSDSAKVPNRPATRQSSVPAAHSTTIRPSATSAPSLATQHTASEPTPDGPAESQPPSETSQKPTAAKRGGRKRTAAQASSDQPQNGELVESIEAGPPPVKRTRQKKTQPQPGAADGTAEATSPKPKRQRKKREPEGGQDGGAVEGGKPRPARRRPSRARSETPPDAEEQVVDIQTMKMADLTKDLRIGKKFSRHDELRARERKERLRQSSSDPTKASQTPGPSGSSDSPGVATPAQATNNARPISAPGPQFQIVNGQIIIDQSSLVMDRHARDAFDGPIEEIEENEFTHKVTSNSYRTGSKLRGPNHWSAEDTEKFYGHLKVYGTDFTILASLFPGRQRRHLKMKFNREERFAKHRVDAALVGPKEVRMNFEEYQAATGMVYEQTEEIQAELQREHDEREAMRLAEEEADAEINRKKLEAIHGGGDKKRKGKEESVAPKTKA
ncbi:uncharacterized protein DNG_07234 [Cephalotrichum gorgonifer]|uniref:Transcription factor TFIIIB component B'' Myb domain-containing protein n=1 Tax=Cephalotrichum gorgonifer TaxID=2041049 RepID=A0AAE8N2Z0_9PEZI|nr:uncharacterized protein DNG_07234 [Cephalotrichum gorgonifer]